MRKSWRIGFSASTVMALAILALPPSLSSTPRRGNAVAQRDVQYQSMSGKITSVQKNAFTLEVNAKGLSGQQFQQERNRLTTMSFLIDQNTTVDGKLQVGGNAQVMYRQEDGN